jgi:AcrR family transcriptional regulator
VKKKPTEDRRVQRTRKLLQDALVSIMIEKGYEATTVQDIIDRANVGRATFYAHFADKNTLLTSRIDDLRDFLTKQQQAVAPSGERKARGFRFSLPMLEHALGHLPLYQAIVGRESGAFVMQRIYGVIADLVRNDLVALGLTRASERRDLLVQYLTGGFMAVMTWWADHGAKLSPAAVDAIFCQLSMQGLGTELGLRSDAD